MEHKLSVADFYKCKSIFITGGTGFLGKVYIKKVLYSCPTVNRIYMLVRASSKEESKQRVEHMINNSSQLFQNLKESDFAKIVPIVGDLAAPDLGIQPDDEDMLLEEVSIIVNSAATLNLKENFKDAININVKGTQNLLTLAKKIKKFEAFVHISTLYCALSSEETPIEEKVYRPPILLNDLNKIEEIYGHMSVLPKNIMSNKRNIYVFTKSIAESVVSSYHGDLPAAIIRPSLIGCSYNEPHRGWIDVINVHSFIMTAAANGVFRVVKTDKDTVWDFIPVDYVANLMILAATKCKRSKDVDVYNCASSVVNPVRISDAISIFISNSTTNKTNVMPFPFVLYVKSNLFHKLLTLLLASTPAHINDLWRTIIGKNPISVKYNQKLLEVAKSLRFFGGISWKAKADRVLSLVNTLNDEDKKIFPCDPSDIDWSDYLTKYSEGIRNFIINNNRKSKL